jgi:hypothetical protein
MFFFRDVAMVAGRPLKAVFFHGFFVCVFFIGQVNMGCPLKECPIWVLMLLRPSFSRVLVMSPFVGGASPVHRLFLAGGAALNEMV